MNLRRINYHCSCGSCDECTGGNAKSYFDGLTQVPNIEQIVPIPGPAGEGSVLTAGKTDSSGILNADGADEALDSTAKANLLAADFDITAKSTTQNVVDASDLNNNKVWTGLSKGFLNLIGLKILPARVKTGGTVGQVYTKSSGTDYDAAWAAQTGEIYNCTTTTDFSYTIADIGTTKDFTVPSGMSYRFKNSVAIASVSDPLNNYVEGIVVGYSATTLNLLIKNIKGTGSTLNWNVMLTAPEYLPYSGDPLNKNKFLYNDNGVLKYSVSSFYPGMCLPHFGVSGNIPSGFLSCDGTTQTQLEYPDLYDFLRPSGVVNQFARTPLGVLLAVDEFSLPYTIGNTLVGVDTTDSNFNESGKRYGSKNHVIVAADLPVTSPWTIPNHAHTVPNSTSNPGGAAALNTDNVNTNTPANTDTSSVSLVHNPNTGGGTALSLFQPSIACIWIIKT